MARVLLGVHYDGGVNCAVHTLVGTVFIDDKGLVKNLGQVDSTQLVSLEHFSPVYADADPSREVVMPSSVQSPAMAAEKAPTPQVEPAHGMQKAKGKV